TIQVNDADQRPATPSKASREYSPKPVRASANAAAPYSSGSSIPLLAANNPCSQCTVIAATIMTETIRAGPIGPSKPSATSRPLTISLNDAAAAKAGPG